MQDLLAHRATTTRRSWLRLAAGVVGACCLTAGLAAPSRAETMTVTIAIQYGYAYLPVIVAEKLDLFRKHAPGTTVAIQRVSGAPAINDALISGSIDIGAYGLPGLLIAAEKTRGSIDIRGLAALVAGDNGLYANKPEIRSLADFGPGDRIAVTSTTGQQAILLRMAAEKAFGAGQARRLDTLMVQLPHPDATTALAVGGTISGYAGPHPYSDLMEREPKVHRLFYFSDYLGERVTSGLLATTGRFVSENPRVAAAVVAAIAEAAQFIRDNPGPATEMFLQSEKSNLSKEDLEAMIKGVAQEWGVQPQGVMSFAGFMARTGQLKAPPPRWQDVFFSPVADGTGS